MIRFKDGPAAGVVLAVRRGPLYLRVTCSTCDPHGWDALDQITDRPEPEETVYAYRRQGAAGSCHIDYRDRQGRRKGAWYATGDYALVPDQPPDEVLRDNRLWAEWATAQAAQAT